MAATESTRKSHREYMRRWMAKQREQGLCTQCINPVVSGRTKCREHLDRLAERARNRRKTDDEKIKRRARNAVGGSVQRGTFPKGSVCEKCGSGHQVQAHHDNYANYYGVKWLCSRCHALEHMRRTALDSL